MSEHEIILPKPVYHSKRDLLRKMPYIKTEKNYNISEISKNTNLLPLKKKYANLSKKNLTYQNFLEYNYDLNNITENKIRMPDHLKIKKKYELLIDSDYSSFTSKNSNKNNKKISNFLITGLNTPNNKYKKYNQIYPGKQNSFENSEIKTKASSNKHTKSFVINYNYSNKKDYFFSSSLSKSFIHFHGRIDQFTKNENKDEGLKAFIQKSRIILKEKIIQKELENKLNYQSDIHVEKINDLNKKDLTFRRNYYLLNIYDDIYVHYLRYLKQKLADESIKYNKSKKQKIMLENEVTSILKKIEKNKNKLTYFRSIEKFFKYTKEGLQSLSEKENQKELKINNKKPKQAVEEKQLKENQQNFNKLVGMKLLSLRNKKTPESNDNKKLNSFSRYNSFKNSIKKPEPILILNNLNDDKTERNNIKRNKAMSVKRKSVKKASVSVFKRQYDYIFTNYENKILQNLEITDNQRKKIWEEKKNLEEAKNISNQEKNYIDEIIIQKENILYNLKKDNKLLKQKLNSYSETTYQKELSQNILEQKILFMISNIEPKLNIPEIVKIKNLYSMLKLNPQDFLERFRTTKIMFLIKIIELIIFYLISKKNEYLSEPKLKETLKDFLYALENEKKIRMNNLNKKMIKEQMEKRKIKAYDKATRVRFLAYRKFDLNNFKIKKNKSLKDKYKSKTMNDNQYDEWILYN
jgi:hypothetical protein